jgi:hypothetical protein
MKRTLLSILLVLAAGAVGMFVLRPSPTGDTIALPTPVAYKDVVILEHPLSGGKISSPLTVSGRARGTWYFEASFPVILKDSSGTVLAQAPAQAQGDWMTENWVPFTVTLQFNVPGVTGTGTLTLQKDNPSGLPEYDDALMIPVVFGP